MSVPLWAFLAVYGAFLVFFLLYVLFNFYHLFRFGTKDFGLFTVIAVFLLGTLGILMGTYAILIPYDWTASIPLSGLFEWSGSIPYFPKP